MSHNSGYHRSGTHVRSFYPGLATISSSDSGQIYGATRGMGPPSMDFPPQPVEIDVDLSISRTLPSPATAVTNPWDATYPHVGFADGPYGSSNMARMQQQVPSDNQTRGPTQDPLAIWYSENDGPWVPKVIPAAIPEDGGHLKKRGNRTIVSYGSSYRQPNPSEAGSVPYAIPTSDSGYGTRRSIGNASVFSADVPERDQDCHSLAGHLESFQPFPSFVEVPAIRDTRLNDPWNTPPTPGRSDTSGLICPGCNKGVKTQSELKKHELRHTKPYKCQVAGCTRLEGFSTTNDLDRHMKSKHAAAISGKKYRCNVPGCKSRDKSWPRLDNFRSHLKRVHQNQLRSDEDFEEILRNAEFWEGPSADINNELLLPQAASQDTPRAVEPSNDDSAWKQTESHWTNAPPDLDNTPHPQAAPKSPGLDLSMEKVVEKEAPAPSAISSCLNTVQPLEVFTPPVRDSGHKFTVASVLSPEAPETATRISHIINVEDSSSQLLEGKTIKQADLSAADEALTKAIKVVLSSSIAREPSNQETTRNILPSGRPSPSNTSDSKSRLAASSNGLTDIVKAGGSQPSNLEIDLSDAQGKVIEAIVKTVRNFGYTLKEHREASSSPPPKILNAGSVAGKKSDKQVICEICKKFKGRPCELKKHMKRHNRPYGCTFLSCSKKFGSKNDWKRHENSQHFQIETWRCDGQRPEGGACSKVCYRKLSFQDHLKKEHKFSDDEEVLSDKVEACRIGRNCQDRFWCGFCIKLVSLRKKGLEAWTERFDHIDDHFMGRNGLIAQGIEDWIPVDGSGKVKETQTTLDASPRSDGSSSGSSSSGSSVDADMEPPPRPAVRPAAKRPRPEETEAPSHKRPRPNEAVIIVCCQCNLQNNPELNESCSNCSTGHTFCENCQTEYRPKEDRSPPHELP